MSSRDTQFAKNNEICRRGGAATRQKFAALREARIERAATDELDTITKLSAKGVHLDTIARAIGLTRPLFDRCLDERPEVRAAINAGRAQMHDKLVGVLFKRALDGELVPALFLLKTQFGYREGELPPDAARSVSVVINMPGAPTLADYTPPAPKLIEAEASDG